MKKHIKFTIQAGGTFSIVFQHGDPEQAQRVTQRLAETLMTDDRTQRVREAVATRTFLEEERQRLASDFREKEDRLRSFLQTNPEAARADAMMGVDPARALMLEQQLQQLRAQRDALVTSGDPAAVIATPEDLRLAEAQAEEELLAARRDFADKKGMYTEAHPDVRVAEDRLKRATAGLSGVRQAKDTAREVARSAAAKRALTPEEARIGASIDALEATLGKMRGALRAGQDGRRPDPKVLQAEVQLQGLRHAVEESRTRLGRIEDQALQIGLVEKMEGNQSAGTLTLYERAYRPSAPSSNRKKKVALLGGLVVVMLACGTALARAVTDDRLFDGADVAFLTPVEVLAAVPRAGQRIQESS
jgi:hypothetical protein